MHSQEKDDTFKGLMFNHYFKTNSRVPAIDTPGSVRWEVGRYRLQRRFYAGQMGGWVNPHWGSPAAAVLLTLRSHQRPPQTLSGQEDVLLTKLMTKLETSEAGETAGCYPSVKAQNNLLQ